MHVEVKKNIFITSDSKSFSLVKLTGQDKDGKDTYVPLGHYSTLKGVIRGFLEHGIRTSAATTIQELVEVHDELVDHVRNLFPEVGIRYQ